MCLPCCGGLYLRVCTLCSAYSSSNEAIKITNGNFKWAEIDKDSGNKNSKKSRSNGSDEDSSDEYDEPQQPESMTLSSISEL